MEVLQRRGCARLAVEVKLKTLLYVATMDAKTATGRSNGGTMGSSDPAASGPGLGAAGVVEAGISNSAALGGENEGGTGSGVTNRIQILFHSFLQSFQRHAMVVSDDVVGDHSSAHVLLKLLEEYPQVLPLITQQLWNPSFGSRTEFVAVLHRWWLAVVAHLGVAAAAGHVEVDGVVQAALHLIGTGRMEEVDASVRLCTSLLLLGKLRMQTKFADLLCKTSRRGSHSSLARIRHYLRQSRDDLRELRIIAHQLAADYVPEPGQRPKTLEALVADSGLFNVGRRQRLPLNLLSLIRALASAGGHYHRLQELAGGSVHGVNLAAEIAEVLLEACQSLSPLNVALATSCVTTLTRLAQGPCRLVQSTLIMQTPLLQAVNLLILSQAGATNSPASSQTPAAGNVPKRGPVLCESIHNGGSRVSTGPGYARQLRSLKREASDLMLAVLEGMPPVTPVPPLAQRVLDGLNLRAVAGLVIELHADWAQERDPEDREAGIAFLVLLKTLERFSLAGGFSLGSSSGTTANVAGGVGDLGNGVNFGLVDPMSAAYQHFAPQIAMVEVLHAGCLVPYFFRVPESAQGEVGEGQRRRLYDEILPSLILRPEYEALLCFCRHAEALAAELDYAHLLKGRSWCRMLGGLATVCSAMYMANVLAINVLILVSFRYQEEPISSAPATLRSDGSDDEPSVPLFDIQVIAQVLLQRFFCLVQLALESVLLLDHAVSVTPILLLRRINRLDDSEDDDSLDPSDCAGGDVHGADPKSPSGKDGAQAATDSRQKVGPRSAGELLMMAVQPGGLIELVPLIFRDLELLWRLAATIITAIVVYACALSGGLQQRAEPLLLTLLLCEVLKKSRTVDMIRETVAESGRVIIPVVCMGTVFVYWFSVIGFLTYPNIFQFRKAEVRFMFFSVDQCFFDLWSEDTSPTYSPTLLYFFAMLRSCTPDFQHFV
mmetsp:Transcript_39488/g.104905  ORF Transcript_39488/g.104905 Transcript_39488/m.104905 type:complete len:944 (+) Transcript_39488:4004-6835(+)